MHLEMTTHSLRFFSLWLFNTSGSPKEKVAFLQTDAAICPWRRGWFAEVFGAIGGLILEVGPRRRLLTLRARIAPGFNEGAQPGLGLVIFIGNQ
jgi:hypothetical protein